MTGAADDERGTSIARLYDACGARLYRYAVMVLGDAEDAADVVQHVFASLLDHKIVMPAEPEAYLWRAVRNAAFSTLRRRRTVREAPDSRLLVPMTTDCPREE